MIKVNAIGDACPIPVVKTKIQECPGIFGARHAMHDILLLRISANCRRLYQMGD